MLISPTVMLKLASDPEMDAALFVVGGGFGAPGMGGGHGWPSLNQGRKYAVALNPSPLN